MVKAIFVDLDGTLLDGEKRVTEATLEALNKCKEIGIKIFAATGRPPTLNKMFPPDEKFIALFDGGTYHNGGCVIVGEKRFETYVPEGVVRGVFGLAKTYASTNVTLQLAGDAHAFWYPLEDSAYRQWGIKKEETVTIEEALGQNIVKMIVFHENLNGPPSGKAAEMLDAGLLAKTKRICEGKALTFYNDAIGTAVTVNAPDADKKDGVEKIRARLGLGKDEIAVFGDDVNDVGMLSAFPLSFAMGNAADSVKSAAWRVIPDNDSDGIAHALREVLRLI
ncbi:MAG: HAD hydrolase family protein [Defluviitaleaceae bacterium]|nr:HAD hydrolase family protein [Defluviitaleaceae bacterium]